jgi:hypothetical protein
MILRSAGLTLGAGVALGAVFGGIVGASRAGPPIGTPTCGVVVNCAMVTVYPSRAALATGSGVVTSSPSGVSCTESANSLSGACTFQFSWPLSQPQLMVSLTATPDQGSLVCTYPCQGGASAQAQTTPWTLSPGDAASFAWTFSLSPETLTVSRSGLGTGRVTSSPAGIDCGSTCAATFGYGESVTLTATPDPGALFSRWTGDCAGQPAACTVTLNQATSVAASFGLPGTTTAATTTTTTTSTATTTTQSTTTTTTTTTAATTTAPIATTTTGTAGSPGALRIVAAPSRAMPHALWLDARPPDSAGKVVQYSWDTNGNGKFDWTCGGFASAMSISYPRPGTHTVALRIVNAAGNVETTQQSVVVSRSEASFASPTSAPVLDCENPGANLEPDRAGCIKTFGFGIVTVNSQGELSDCFKLTVSLSPQALVRHGLLRRTQSAAAASFVDYHAEIDGPVLINGLLVPIPESQHSVYDTGDNSIGLGQHEMRFDGWRTPAVDLSLKVTPDRFGVFRVANVQLLGKALRLAGLPVDASASVDFLYRKTRVTFTATLPNIFTFAGGKPAQAQLVAYLANGVGFELDGATVSVDTVFVGPMTLRHLTFSYSKSKDTWQGGAQVFLLPGASYGLDASGPPKGPPDGGFGLIQGRFDHAGLGIVFPPAAGPEVFPGLFLSTIELALGTNPLRFEGALTLSAAQAIDIDGSAFVAFASPGTPYQFPPESGDLAALAGRELHSFTIAVGGVASLHVPFLDSKIALANAYLLYEYPSYFELAGGFRFGYSFLSIDGGVHGFADGGSGKWDLDAGVKACLKNIAIGPVNLDFLCDNVGGVVSSKGIGFCTTFPLPTPFGTVPVPVGAGYAWGDALPDLMVFSCDYGPWTESIPASFNGPRLQNAGDVGPQRVTLPGGLPSTMIRVSGTGAPPDVTVTEPGGTTISTANPPRNRNILVIKLRDANLTYVAIDHPAGGNWQVKPRPGSAVSAIAVAVGLPAPAVRVTVLGSGPGRTLVYRSTPAPGRRVTLAERGPAVYHLIGAANGSSGRIRFTPAGGPGGVRQIVAEIDQNGTPERTLVAGSYRASSPPLLHAPQRIRMVRHSASVTLTWHTVPGAARYTITIRESDGVRSMTVTRDPSATLPLNPTVGAQVSISALAPDGSSGPPGRTTIRRGGR